MSESGKPINLPPIPVRDGGAKRPSTTLSPPVFTASPDRRDPNATEVVPLTAAKGVTGGKPALLVDGGVENFKGAVATS